MIETDRARFFWCRHRTLRGLTEIADQHTRFDGAAETYLRPLKYMVAEIDGPWKCQGPDPRSGARENNTLLTAVALSDSGEQWFEACA